jgi:hypothetical protein
LCPLLIKNKRKQIGVWGFVGFSEKEWRWGNGGEMGPVTEPWRRGGDARLCVGGERKSWKGLYSATVK